MQHRTWFVSAVNNVAVNEKTGSNWQHLHAQDNVAHLRSALKPDAYQPVCNCDRLVFGAKCEDFYRELHQM